ncbi:ubiquinone/menaquinone biosynthesis C-methylase UbiE [Haloactinopolyspora alba]|uniref:Ubiquinone/menaquinone biosynthesis C-methylase UbiE n=1 Tax=Haloactinopolyspora alba TaxID=648780 RepID=A0A2P8E0A7_9ACTN|nr:class I SAM-dependent methyltransferase [Haloactinopolyspora alba]PSL02847.1 ubiquinone/menaquinone biosynthesis C-methylase UbiE [Haloactinopolyspora alba]
MDITNEPRRPAWLLDEVASAGRENLDATHARRYDAKEDAGADDEVPVLRAHGLTDTSVVVDLGAGTGQFTLAAAAECARVVAVDVSDVMLEQLRAKVSAAGASNVEVVRAGFLTYQHTGPLADFVYTRYALHHLPDFWKAIALDRARRMLRVGGVLRVSDVIFGFDPADAEERIEAWCASVDGRGDDEWHRADVEEHVRDEHSTFTWLFEPMLQRAGFVVDDVSRSPDGVVASYLARAAPREERPTAAAAPPA